MQDKENRGLEPELRRQHASPELELPSEHQLRWAGFRRSWIRKRVRSFGEDLLPRSSHSIYQAGKQE